MIKYLLSSIIFIFATCILFGQSLFIPKIKVDYQLVAQKSLKENALSETEIYILFANEKEAVFKAKKAHKLDSIKALGEGIDKQSPYFRLNGQHNINITKKIIDFSDLVMNHELGYKEENKMQWKLENDTKLISGINCQKATISKYGRNWIAYFSKTHQFPFGPHKFNGLPGLIIELFDDNGEYHFIASRISEHKESYLRFRFAKAKYISKAKFLKVKENIETDYTLGGKIKVETSTLKKLRDLDKEDKKFANPIELKPY